MTESAFRELDWELKLTARERASFARLCEKEGTSAGQALTELTRACLRNRGTVLFGLREWDQITSRALDWWLKR